MEVYIVRHALSRENLGESAEGYDPFFVSIEERDCSLAPVGVQQAEITGDFLKNVEFTGVLCSPYHRTLSTAAGILKYQKNQLPIEVMKALVELETPNSFSLMPRELQSGVWYDIRMIREYEISKPETEYDIWKRGRSVVDYVFERFSDDDKVLIVSHCGFICKSLVSNFLGLSAEWSGSHRFGVQNCSVTKIVIEDNGQVSVPVICHSGHLGNLASWEPPF